MCKSSSFSSTGNEQELYLVNDKATDIAMLIDRW